MLLHCIPIGCTHSWHCFKWKKPEIWKEIWLSSHCLKVTQLRVIRIRPRIKIFLHKLHSPSNQTPNIRLQLLEAFHLDAIPGKHQRKIVHVWLNSRQNHRTGYFECSSMNHVALLRPWYLTVIISINPSTEFPKNRSI